MAELALTEIIQRLSIHQDEYGEQIGEAIRELVGALGVSDFLEKVRQNADTLFRSDSLMRYMADLLQQGFDPRQLSDHDLYVNPRGIPLNGAGSEIFVLFPEPTGRVINHPRNIVGHYYGEGEICGHEGEVSLHGAMRANMDGESKLSLYGQSRAVLGGNAYVELFDQSRVNPRDRVSVKLHDFSSAFLMEKDSACEIKADGFSHLIVEKGKHLIQVSDDVLFMDVTDSDVQVQDRCCGYKPKGNTEKDPFASGLIWREENMAIEVDFRNRIHSRRCAGEELSRPYPNNPDRINRAKELLGTYAKKASLPEEFRMMLNHSQSMDSMAQLLSTYMDKLLENGLPMQKIKMLFQSSELSAARIYTSIERVPSDIEGRYHVFDHLIVPQTSNYSFGIFHDHSIGIIKAGVSQSDGMALTAGEGTAMLKASDHSTMLLRETSKGVAEEESLGFATDQSQIKAKDFTVIEARGNATVNANGHSITELRENAVGSFSEKAMFMAADHSRYTLADDAKGVAHYGDDGSLPVSLIEGKEVPTVTERDAKTFYTNCLRERGDALAVEIREKTSKKIHTRR